MILYLFPSAPILSETFSHHTGDELTHHQDNQAHSHLPTPLQSRQIIMLRIQSTDTVRVARPAQWVHCFHLRASCRGESDTLSAPKPSRPRVEELDLKAELQTSNLLWYKWCCSLTSICFISHLFEGYCGILSDIKPGQAIVSDR